jgi:hypothetical protein
MKSSIQPSQQGNFLLPELRSQLDRRQGLYKLAERIDWGVYEVAFGHLYSEEGSGTPSPKSRKIGWRARRESEAVVIYC